VRISCLHLTAQTVKSPFPPPSIQALQGANQKIIIEKTRRIAKTFNSRYSPVVTRLTTGPPVRCFYTSTSPPSRTTSIINTLKQRPRLRVVNCEYQIALIEKLPVAHSSEAFSLLNAVMASNQSSASRLRANTLSPFRNSESETALVTVLRQREDSVFSSQHTFLNT
jgi:CRISPR/Cas system endoribonuclease Cas6 (RAMP superfamily)